MTWVKAEKDKEIVNHMRFLGDEQLKISKQNIDIINVKVHDLKKQLAFASGDGDFIDGAKKAVVVYDSFFHTGSEALDIILTDKALRCGKQNIKLYAMINGAELSFLTPSEINAIFGNALDNAIEYEETVEDERKRFISVNGFAKGDFFIIKIENYCEKTVNMKGNGLPETNKKDKNYHGYGTLSMKMTVESRGGKINFKTEDDLFKVNIIFL